MNSLAIVVLSAGSSSRLGQNKQLISVEGQALITRQCRELLLLDIPVYCVLGYQADQIAQALKVLPEINLIENAQWSEGLGGSIAVATEVLKTQFEHLLFILGDQWQLNAELLSDFITSSALNQSKITVATYKLYTEKLNAQNKNAQQITICGSADSELSINSLVISDLSPPVVFNQRYYHELCLLTGDKGAKSLLQKHLQKINAFYLPQAFIDLDTPEQLAVLRKIYPK